MLVSPCGQIMEAITGKGNTDKRCFSLILVFSRIIHYRARVIDLQQEGLTSPSVQNLKNHRSGLLGCDISLSPLVLSSVMIICSYLCSDKQS